MLTLGLWVVFAGRMNIQVMMFGTIICSILSHLLANSVFRFVHLNGGPKQIVIKITYMFFVFSAFLYDVFLSAVKVSRQAFAWNPSFSPRIVKLKTSDENSSDIGIFAHFLTCTQGALALDFDPLHKNYVIHWIDVDSDAEAETRKALIRKQEHLVAKIFHSEG